MSDDRKLVRRCLAGDAKAISQLVKMYQGLVYGFSLRMVRHAQDAEDITQQVLVRTLRSLKGWDATRPLRTWILAIAANRCRTHLAKQSRQPVLAQDLADVADQRRPDRDWDLAAELELALAPLRPEYRMVVVMFHEQEMPYEAISATIGRPIGTVKTWLHRARAEMARSLAQQAGMHGLCPQANERVGRCRGEDKVQC